ncbi:hypothetical protein P7C73_g6360, partial [Tremellales sp. Uapishka_1]
MILSPLSRLFRRLSIPLPNVSSPTSLLTPLVLHLTAAVQRLDLSTDPRKSLHKLSQVQWTPASALPYAFMAACALFSLFMMQVSIVFKLFLAGTYAAAILLPITSQFVLPATPIFAWLITFFSARFIPSAHRPGIHVALLPALESVLYGANISDLLTRFTNPVLDVVAWVPYGVLHYILPFVVAAVLWVFGPKHAVQYWGNAFGWMNLFGVLTQILFPCAAPWYEIIHGLTPADYAMAGSPGGLMRIDRVFHSSGYTNAFGNSPLVFGAFPSLHSGCAVMEALFLSHFFPKGKYVYWIYTGILWWATMYLSHHYLIDLTAGACFSVCVFYFTMPEKFKDTDAIVWGRNAGGQYEMVNGDGEHAAELDLDEEIRKLEDEGEGSGDIGEDVEEDEDVEAQQRAKKGRSVSWGETKVLGEESR